MGNGPHQFIITSHNPEKFKSQVQQEEPSRDIPYDKIYSEFFDETTLKRFPVLNKFIETMVGKAGTGILADLSGLHRGLPPTEGDRLMVWFRYGLYLNVHTSMTPHNFPRALVPGGDFLGRREYQYINRNFFK